MCPCAAVRGLGSGFGWSFVRMSGVTVSQCGPGRPRLHNHPNLRLAIHSRRSARLLEDRAQHPACVSTLQACEDPTGAIRRADARHQGIPLSRPLSASYQRVFFDAYVPAGLKITPALRARVALQLLPGAGRISHHTAVQLWGGIAPHSPDVHVAVADPVHRSRRQGIAAHLAKPDDQTSVRHGVLVSSPAQAFLELAAAGVSLVDLVVAGDSLVKSTGISPQAFVEHATGSSCGNARRALRAARLNRTGVDSAMETRLRLLIVLAGLPEPTVNLILRDERGEWALRFDLCYPDLQLIVEYDGRQHAESDKQWARDIERREQLDRMGWRLLVIRADGIYVHPGRTLATIHDVLLERKAPCVPKQLRAEWMRHFPSRA